MFTKNILRVFNFNPTIEVTDKYVIVYGIDGHRLNRIISKVYKTSRIQNYLFTKYTGNRLEFHLFFALEVYLILKRVLTAPDNYNIVPKRTISQVLDLLENNTWVKHALSVPDLNELTLPSIPLKYTPMPDQEKFLKTYLYRKNLWGLNGMMLAADAGTGKTFTSLALGQLLSEKPSVTIIISPLPAVNKVWDDSLNTLFNHKVSYWTALHPLSKLTFKEQYIVVNYDFVPKLLTMIKRFDISNPYVIIDEAHNYNDVKALRTKLLFQLLNILKSKNIVPLTGTPVKAMSLEVIPLLKMIDPYFTEKAEDSFKRMYSGATGEATEILRQRLELIQYKIKKNIDGVEPPISIFHSVKVEGGEQLALSALKVTLREYVDNRREYYRINFAHDSKIFYSILDAHSVNLKGQALNDYNTYRADLKYVIATGGGFNAVEQMAKCNQYELNNLKPSISREQWNQFKSVRTQIKYVDLKVMGEALGNVIGEARRKASALLARQAPLVDIIEDTEKKTIIFSNHIQAVDTAYFTLRSLGYQPLKVTGENAKDLPAIVTKFETDPNANPLTTTYATLSTAVPLVMADTLILLDVPFRAHILEQAIARVWRIGATTQAKVHYLKLDTGTEPNITDRTFDILAWAKSEVEAITGVTSPIDVTKLNEDNDKD